MTTARQLLTAIWQHPANHQRRYRAIVNATIWQLRKRCGKPYQDREFHGLNVRCYANSHAASPLIYFNNAPDYREMTFMQAYLRSGDNVIDVGANIGVYSLLAAALTQPNGQIEAFEPITTPAAHLQENIATNHLEKRIHVHKMAVGEHCKEVQFTETGDDCTGHIATTPTATTITVQQTTLDKMLPTRRYQFAKLDIEGAELNALKGASQHLAHANPPVWQLEFTGSYKRYGIASKEFFSFLSQHGYKTYLYDPVSGQLLPNTQPWKFGEKNLLAIHQEKLTWVEHRLSTSH